jgi:protein TonB
MTAMLQWKFTPDPNIARKLMTVTCNFTLSGVTGGVVAGNPGAPPPPPPGVAGGVSGGVSGGVAGGVQGGVFGAEVSGPVLGGIVSGTSFGLPGNMWPTNAVRVGGNIAAPVRTYNVPAAYPSLAQTVRVQGMVIVEVLIGEDGSVQGGRILRSIPLLDQAAMEAVQQWRFQPTLLNGVAIPVIMTTTVNFTLQ